MQVNKQYNRFVKKIYFVSTNEYKVKQFSNSIRLKGFKFERMAEQTLEIQASSNQEVSSFSAKWVADKVNLPAIKEDVGLYIHALKGFPGPYLGQIEKWIESDGFLDLMKNKSDRSAHWECSVSYCEPGRDAVTFYTHQKGSIAYEARGNGGWFADKIFVPEDSEKTIAELLDEDKYVRNEDHYKQLEEYLLALM